MMQNRSRLYLIFTGERWPKAIQAFDLRQTGG